MQLMKHVGFCAGAQFEIMDSHLINGLAYCVDNDPNKWGTEIMGIPIVSPDRLLEENKKYIFVYVYSTVHFQEISAQLKEMGFLEDRHYALADYAKFWVNSPKIIFNAAFLTWFGPKDGDYYEFGVYKGGTLFEAYRIISEVDRFCDLRYIKSDELSYDEGGIPAFRCFCFDSFEGLPKPKGIDIGGAFREGDYQCDFDTFVDNICSAGLDMERVSIVKGWYSDLNKQTQEQYDMGSARIIHIDCDLYESTRDALAFCTNLIADGTVIIFDDWFHFRGHPHRGEQQAFREWRDANPQFICTEYMREYPFRNSFIINIA